MKKQTYLVYSVSCWAVWALIFIIRFAFHWDDTNHLVLYIFTGWVIGWLGATIAHSLHR